MYKSLLRPVFFLFKPETIHHWVMGFLKTIGKIPGKRQALKWFFSISDTRLEKELFGIRFPNPVGVAAGFDKNAEVYEELSAFGFGFVEIGTVTPKAQPGNPKPRLFRLSKDNALINRMGFNNNGLEQAVKQLRKRKTQMIIGGNIGKNTLTPNSIAYLDYEENFIGLFDYVDYFVVNVSCPNISDLKELQDQEALMEILNKLQAINNSKPKRKPVLLKISPDLNDKQLDEVIEIVRLTKIDGVVATNTSIKRNLPNYSEGEIAAIGNGGLSGQPVRDRSTEIIRYLATKSNKAFPIIGVGGIFTVTDALVKLDAGADLIQVYTGFIYEGPFIARNINRSILKRIKSDLSLQ
jgi:dihydroorotate dehydrogenase